MDGLPKKVPKGFAGTQTSSVNSVISEIDPINSVITASSSTVRPLTRSVTKSIVQQPQLVLNQSNIPQQSLAQQSAFDQQDELNNTIGRNNLASVNMSNSDSTLPASTAASSSILTASLLNYLNFNASSSANNSSTLSNLLNSAAGSSNTDPNNTIVSFSGTISRTIKDKAPQCILCDQIIVDRAKCVKCSVCLGLIHFKCAESGMMDETFLKIVQKKGQIHYTCAKCAPSAAKQIRIVNKDGTEESPELRKAVLQISSNEDYIRRQAAELDRVTEVNTQMQLQLSQMQLKMKETGTSPFITNDAELLADLQTQL